MGLEIFLILQWKYEYKGIHYSGLYQILGPGIRHEIIHRKKSQKISEKLRYFHIPPLSLKNNNFKKSNPFCTFFSKNSFISSNVPKFTNGTLSWMETNEFEEGELFQEKALQIYNQTNLNSFLKCRIQIFSWVKTFKALH